MAEAKDAANRGNVRQHEYIEMNACGQESAEYSAGPLYRSKTENVLGSVIVYCMHGECRTDWRNRQKPHFSRILNTDDLFVKHANDTPKNR